MSTYKRGDTVRITNIEGNTDAATVGTVFVINHIYPDGSWICGGSSNGSYTVKAIEVELVDRKPTIEDQLIEMLDNLRVANNLDTGNFQYDRGFSMAASFVTRDVERILNDYRKDQK